MTSTESLLEFCQRFVAEWRETWVDPDETSHEWSELYREACRLTGMEFFCEGDGCPECGNAKLEYDSGSSQTREEPEQREALFCPSCGVEFSIHRQRLENYQTAKAIAADLLDDGPLRKQSRRLVIEEGTKLNGRGWCRGAIVDRVAEKLDRAVGIKR